MKKNTIKLNEEHLRKVISKSIRKALDEGYSFDLKKKYYSNYQKLADVYNNLYESLDDTREQFYFFEELLKGIDQSVHSYENDLIKEIFFSLRNARESMGKAFHEIEGVLGLIDGGIQFTEQTDQEEQQ